MSEIEVVKCKLCGEKLFVDTKPLTSHLDEKHKKEYVREIINHGFRLWNEKDTEKLLDKYFEDI